MHQRFRLAGLLAIALAPIHGIRGQQPQGATNKQVINRPDARPGGVLSAAVRVGDLLFLSGVMGTKPGGGGLEIGHVPMVAAGCDSYNDVIRGGGGAQV